MPAVQTRTRAGSQSSPARKALLVRLLDGRVQAHLHPEAPSCSSATSWKYSGSQPDQAIFGFQQHDPGLDGRPPGSPFPEVPEQDGDLGGQLHPGRAPAGYGDREVAGLGVEFRRRTDRREPGFPQGAAQPERVVERREQLEVRGQTVGGCAASLPVARTR